MCVVVRVFIGVEGRGKVRVWMVSVAFVELGTLVLMLARVIGLAHLHV